MIKKTYSNILFVIKLAYETSPVLFVCTAIIALLHGTSHTLITYVLEDFFSIFESSSSSEIVFKNILFSCLLLTFVYVLNQIINGIHNVVSEDLGNRYIKHFSIKLQDRINLLNPVDFENTEKLDEIEKAKKGVMNSAFFIFVLSMILTYYIPYLVTMGFYLYSLSPFLVVIIIFLGFPIMINQIIKVRIFSTMEDKQAIIRRENQYFANCLTNKNQLKEIRVFNAKSFFMKKLKNSTVRLNDNIWQATKQNKKIDFFMKLFSLFGYVLSIYILFRFVMIGEISISQFFAIFTSLAMIFKVLDEMITRHFGRLSEKYSQITNFIKFMKEESLDKNKIIIQKPDITLNNVCFKYPYSQDNALDSVSLRIPYGRKIALVGVNGSGKTTLAKVIMGIFDPTKGSVCYNKQNISNINKNTLMSKSSAVFQNYQKYKLSSIDNVIISSSNSLSDIKLIKQTLFDTGYLRNSINLDLVLSREFNGIEISGGEWQKLAISRSVYREFDLLLFDEPTASIDPYEENNIYNLYNRISNEKTSILVTHRLGACKMVDTIIVLEKGKIVETGSHDELLAKEGLYYKMFRKQQETYSNMTKE